MKNEEKQKKLKAIQSLVSKKFGESALMLMDDKPKAAPSISTGSIGLDLNLGIGGIPQGRITEIYGPEASGKTTLTLHIAAECQKAGGTVAFIDAEHALDAKYATNIGVDMQELLLSQPDYGEQALDITETLVHTGEVDLIIIDSVAALTPKAELDGEMGDHNMGLQARMMSKALRKLTAASNKSNTTIIFINQIRMKIGVMFGSPETTTGGNALKFYASLRLDVRRLKAKTGDATEVGIMKVKVVKNKMAPPFKVYEIPITFGIGIDVIAEAYEMARHESFGIFEVRGAHHWYKGDKPVKLSDGTVLTNSEDNKENKFAAKKDDALALLRTNKDFFKIVKTQIQTKLDKFKKEGKLVL